MVSELPLHHKAIYMYIKWVDLLNIGCVRNQKSDWSRSSQFVRRDRSSPMKKNVFVRFYHHDAHYYVTISHNTSVPMTGRLDLGIGTLTSHASWAWLKNLSANGVKSDFSRMHPSRSRFDYECAVFCSDSMWTNLSRSDYNNNNYRFI